METSENYHHIKKLSMASAAPTYDNFPIDLILDILLRLLVESLVRLKAVSKTWLSLISNPSFVDSHLSRSITSTEDKDSLIVHSIENDSNSICLQHLDSTRTAVDLELPYSKGDFPFAPELFIVGSCNGIVCVVITCRHYKYNGLYLWNSDACPNHHIYLWNPATKQSKLLPPHNIDCIDKNFMLVSLGFGFDPVGNDFKVVRIVQFREEVIRAEVYSANRNVWREIELQPMVFSSYLICDVCVKGVLYWTLWDGVVAFDLNKEVFNDYVSFPSNVRPTVGPEYNSRVTVMKDYVAVLIHSKSAELSQVGFWNADHECLPDGIDAPWTQKFTFDLVPGVEWVYGYLNTGDILLKTNDEVWLSYNSDKNESKIVPVNTCRVFKHTKSLVSVRGSKPVK